MTSLSIIGFYLHYETTYQLYISYSAIMTEVNIISFQKLRMMIMAHNLFYDGSNNYFNIFLK